MKEKSFVSMVEKGEKIGTQYLRMLSLKDYESSGKRISRRRSFLKDRLQECHIQYEVLSKYLNKRRRKPVSRNMSQFIHYVMRSRRICSNKEQTFDLFRNYMVIVVYGQLRFTRMLVNEISHR